VSAGGQAGGGGAGGAAGQGGGHIEGASVLWKDKPTEPYTITGDVGLDWGFFYVVALGNAPPGALSLELERCIKQAGAPEQCSTSTLQDPAVEGQGAMKFGVDPSMYNTGENTYNFTLRLRSEGATLASDLLPLVVNAQP
jgi:hypothetical protein